MNYEQPFIIIKNHRKRTPLSLIDTEQLPRYDPNIKPSKWNSLPMKDFQHLDKENIENIDIWTD